MEIHCNLLYQFIRKPQVKLVSPIWESPCTFYSSRNNMDTSLRHNSTPGLSIAHLLHVRGKSLIQENHVGRFRRKGIFASGIITLLKNDPSPRKCFTRTKHSHRKRGEIRGIRVLLAVHVEKRNPFSRYDNACGLS